MQVRDVMTANVISVPAQATILEAARTMLRNRVSGLPVVDGQGQLVGMVTEGDFLRRSEIGTERFRSTMRRDIGTSIAAALSRAVSVRETVSMVRPR